MLNALRRSVGIVIVVSAALACGTPTKLTDEWKDPSYQAGPMKRVVVFSMNVPPATRRLVEDRFVSDLRDHDVQAVQSYVLLGESLPDRETARATLASGGYDGAIVLKLQRVHETTRYVPNDTFYGSPYTAHAGVSSYSPGYVVSDEIVQFETSLWDLRDGKRVWTANTKTTNPSSSKDFAKSLSKEVLPELADEGLLAKSSR